MYKYNQMPKLVVLTAQCWSFRFSSPLKTYNIVWSLVLASSTPPIIFPLNMSFIINLKLIPNMVRAARRTPPKTQVCGLARHLLIGTWLLPISQLPVHEIYNVIAVGSLLLLSYPKDKILVLISYGSYIGSPNYVHYWASNHLVDFGMHSNLFWTHVFLGNWIPFLKPPKPHTTNRQCGCLIHISNIIGHIYLMQCFMVSFCLVGISWCFTQTCPLGRWECRELFELIKKCWDQMGSNYPNGLLIECNHSVLEGVFDF